jgi:transcription elongation factor GreA
VFGATVLLADADTGEEKRYQIVGDLEADIKQGLIAISSPVARALIGKHEGDTATIEAPGGTREYEIIEVGYGS